MMTVVAFRYGSTAALIAPEIEQHHDRHRSKPEPGTPPRGSQLWLIEVHAVDARKKRGKGLCRWANVYGA
jgi:hypothetical protein